MRNLVFAACLFLALGTQAQTKVKVDSSGNYVAINLQDSIKAKETGKATGKFFIDSKGIKYPIYQGAKGGIYYFKFSQKTGNPYKVYINTN